MASLQDEYNTCLYHVSSALHRWLERLAEKHFAEIGLTPTEGFLLMTIQDAPGIQIGILAQVHQVVSSHITRLINRCISNKLVHAEKQGRTTTVFLTRKGMKKEAEARSAWQKLRLEYEGILGREEVNLLTDRLAPAVKVLEAARR